MRSRGWPRSSEYVVGPPQYWIRNSRRRCRAPGEVGRLRVQPQQHRVVGDAVVEGIDEPDEERLAADDVEQRRGRRLASRSRYRRRHGRQPQPREPPAPRDRPVHRRAHRRRPTTCSPELQEPHAPARTGRRHAGRRRPGCPADAADPPRRRAARRRGRDVHRLLVDLHRPRPGAGRQPAVLRRQRGVHGPRPRGVGRGRARPTSSSCASPRRSRRCGRCRPIRSIDLVFIDADKGGYASYFDELAAARPPQRAAAGRQHAVVGPGHRRRRPPTATRRRSRRSTTRSPPTIGSRATCCPSATASR